MKNKIDYSELVNVVERFELTTRIEVVYYLVGYLGKIGKKELDLIRQLYKDGFIEA